jgi:hypothetical protein
MIGYPTTPRGAWRIAGVATVLACVALLAVGGGIAQASTGSIEGTVTNHTAKGVEGIEVSVVDEEGKQLGSTTTASNGKYTIAGIAEGGYTVVFTDKTEVYLTKSMPQSIEEGKAAKLNVVLTKAGSFAGVVTSVATSEGLAGVSVQINGPEGAEELFHGIFTDAHGHYALKHLVPGRYELEFSAEGSYLSQRVSVELAEGEEHLYNVVLTEGGKISGTVTDAYSHAALEKIGVYAYIPGHGGGFAVTNAKGEYTVTGLSSGAYDVEYYWTYSEAEEKEYEKAPAEIPKYITQYYNNQISQGSANTVSVSEGSTTSGVNVAMVASAPHNAAAPAIAGTALVGDVLTCSNGSWAGEGMLSVQSGWPLTSPFGYQWLREGSAISGATLASYVVQSADEGHSLACEVTATNAAGHAASKSNSVAVPRPVLTSFTSKLLFVKDTGKESIACANAACAGTGEITARIAAKHGHKKTVLIAKGSYSLAAGTRGTLTLRLTGSGAKALLAVKHHQASGKLVILVKEGKAVERPVQVSVK